MNNFTTIWVSSFTKGGFYSEGADIFVLSSYSQTSLFSGAWILKLWHFKLLKSCHISAWSGSEGSNRASFYYLSLQSWLRLLFDMIWVIWNISNSKFMLRKIIRFGCLRKWQMNRYLLNKSQLYILPFSKSFPFPPLFCGISFGVCTYRTCALVFSTRRSIKRVELV